MTSFDIRHYEALTSGVGFADWSHRTRLALLGRDRARLLHGLCTNDIQRLKPGDGCEAFLTNGQGHTIGFVDVFCEEERLVVETASGLTAETIRCLDRYVIREDVQFQDLSVDEHSWTVIGPAAEALLANLIGAEVPKQTMGHRTVSTAYGPTTIRRTSFAGPHTFVLVVPKDQGPALGAELAKQGAVACELAAIEVVRMEAGTPIFGLDISVEQLPQEVDRPQALSFTKGCYLGQETVARIDAMGHVNRLLRGLRFVGSDVPPAEAEIMVEGKVVARLSSICVSPRMGGPFAMAYIRRALAAPGTKLETTWGPCEVVRLGPPT